MIAITRRADIGASSRRGVCHAVGRRYVRGRLIRTKGHVTAPPTQSRRRLGVQGSSRCGERATPRGMWPPPSQMFQGDRAAGDERRVEQQGRPLAFAGNAILTTLPPRFHVHTSDTQPGLHTTRRIAPSVSTRMSVQLPIQRSCSRFTPHDSVFLLCTATGADPLASTCMRHVTSRRGQLLL